MKQKILSILEELGVAPTAVTNDVHFVKDLGLDSLDLVDLMMRLEQEFGIRIPDEDYAKLATMNSLLNYLEQEQNVGVAA
jgi:acyl carrier protein